MLAHVEGTGNAELNVWAVDLIRRKRDRGILDDAEINALIQGYLNGAVGEEQMAAFCMAVFFTGMTDAECAGLVQAMLHSGDIVDLSSLPGLKIDKHSTGGVGDKISICLAPLVASCGVPVPMMSGRGLGHTGGTLDKLAAIPGFSSDLDVQTFRNLVETHGFALIGQTERLAPADRRIYALRDTTGTVESIPLIAASIMSKKLAEGIDGLVFDVKVGSGAFMKTLKEAQSLATTLSSIGRKAGKVVSALLTNMDRVLGRAIGNANETWEAIQVLRGEGPDDVRELTLELGIQMLLLGQQARSSEEARSKLVRAIDSGQGFEKLTHLIEAQGGDPQSLESRSFLPQAPDVDVVCFESSGWVCKLDVENVGRAAMWLGAGRARSTDQIDHGVGIEMRVDYGEWVEAGQPIAELCHRGGRGLVQARELLLKAFVLSEDSPSRMSLVLDRVPSTTA